MAYILCVCESEVNLFRLIHTKSITQRRRMDFCCSVFSFQLHFLCVYRQGWYMESASFTFVQTYILHLDAEWSRKLSDTVLTRMEHGTFSGVKLKKCYSSYVDPRAPLSRCSFKVPQPSAWHLAAPSGKGSYGKPCQILILHVTLPPHLKFHRWILANYFYFNLLLDFFFKLHTLGLSF